MKFIVGVVLLFFFITDMQCGGPSCKFRNKFLRFETSKIFVDFDSEAPSPCNYNVDLGYTCHTGDPRGPTEIAVYDVFYDTCIVVTHLGCGGNPNKFPDLRSCYYECIMHGQARPILDILPNAK